MPEHDDGFTALGWFAENGPRDDDEARDAAHALIRRRELADEVALLDALTPFERELADRAASAAHRHLMDAVRKAIGLTSETINATALRAAIPDRLAVAFDQPMRPSPWPLGLEGETRLRAAQVVASARRAADRAERECGLRLAPTPGSNVPTDLEQAASALANEVYAAARLLEDLENAGLVHGNGHHLRQAVAHSAVELLRTRWTGETPDGHPPASGGES